jgi:hypothetical protein
VEVFGSFWCTASFGVRCRQSTVPSQKLQSRRYAERRPKALATAQAGTIVPEQPLDGSHYIHDIL